MEEENKEMDMKIEAKGTEALLEYAKTTGMQVNEDGSLPFIGFVVGKPFKGKSTMTPPRNKEDEEIGRAHV